MFTFTSLHWIYESFYHRVDGITVKRIPSWIAEYITPVGLAHWIMQDGSRQLGQGIKLATHSFTEQECIFLAKILNSKYKLKTSVNKSGYDNQLIISIKKNQCNY